MKFKLLLISLLTFYFIGFSQMRYAKVKLKTGETIDNIHGKLKKKSFKYKTMGDNKSKEIKLSDIELLIIRDSNFDKKYYRFFQTTTNNKYIPVELLVEGDKVNLYVVKYYTKITAQGITLNYEKNRYYVKRTEEEKLTKFPDINLKNNVLSYFSDCDDLTLKIENRDFKMRDGLEQIVEFYNENCKI
ncbi:hypothetical protein FBALC1_01652 [Flavobacteriales bacterium ALC-1]|nr:hypothetical protein FBALC1_01652 [Flavobacteriales bacterium ALC-1]